MNKKILLTFLFLIFICSVISYIYFTPKSQSELLINQPEFLLIEDQRIITLNVKNVGEEDLELQQLNINGAPVFTWYPEKTILEKGEDTYITIHYHWIPEKSYIIELSALPEISSIIETLSPIIEPVIKLQIGLSKIEEDGLMKRIITNYEVDSIANDYVHTILFSYRSFSASKKPVYIFYDPEYMPLHSCNRAQMFSEVAIDYGISNQLVNYTKLETIVSETEPVILIFFEPLMNWLGEEVYNTLPAAILDRDNDIHVIDDSNYSKTFAYDWMHDNGLILMTVGSTQPHKYILYPDGRVYFNKDSFTWNDAGYFLTPGGNESNLLLGNFGIGDYTPTRITSTLGISRWWSMQGFNKDELFNEGIEFYGYGDYNLKYQGDMYWLTVPAFIKTGEGGWLALGDDYNQMSDEIVIHDLIMIFLHSPWDSNWISSGWYWDSGANFHQSMGGIFHHNGTLTTEWIPGNLFDEVVIRIIIIAYNSDYSSIIFQERVIQLT